jgi:HAD superfamily hydrolase (TIGR01509 family)
VSTGRRGGVLVDLDGTLVDTTYLHVLAWSRALVDVGEWAPMNLIHRLIGMGGDQLLPALIGRSDKAIRERHDAHFAGMIGETQRLPGAVDLLRTCKEHGLVVVVATSSGADDVETMLGVVDASDAIDAVTTLDDIERSKPAPDVFLVAMGKAGIEPDATIAIGDSVWDAQAARAAAVDCIGVETGGITAAELVAGGAVEAYPDLVALVDDFATSALGKVVR